MSCNEKEANERAIQSLADEIRKEIDAELIREMYRHVELRKGIIDKELVSIEG